MVVLGGAGTRWGAVIGAIVYVYLQQYLDKVGAEPSFTRLPRCCECHFRSHSFCSAIFVLFVFFAPGASPASSFAAGSTGHPRPHFVSIQKS